MNQDLRPVINVKAQVSQMYCPAFEMLNGQHKLYAYYFSRAAWAGSKICYFQRSFEAPGLFYLLYKIFHAQTTTQIEDLLKQNGFTQDEVNQIFVYVAAFFQNCGNFLSFGDTKFVPEIAQEKFLAFIQATEAYKQNKPVFDQVWGYIEPFVFNYNPPYGHIDLKSKNGANSYYSPNLSKEFIEQLDKFLHKADISELNTRVYEEQLPGQGVVVLVASAEKEDRVELGEVEGKKIILQYGDFKRFLQATNKNLREASKYVSNEFQQKMIEEYIAHFESGDIEKHKASQRYWIQDKGPVIETNIGFIETYLDPMKVRAEFEGFVAVVNQAESKILSDLVDNAEKIIPHLPWPKEFEIEKFSRPDFTSLEVLTFGCSGTPLGINIPNYDDIRQNYGFKNVNLGNVYPRPKKDTVSFIREGEEDLFVKYYKDGLFVIVALHELIGHGSGKLFMSDKDGKLNFQNVTNPFTGEPVTSFYQPHEQWHARFGEFSGAYEECKADAVALYLSTYDEIMQILLPGKDKAYRDDCVRALWLELINSTIKGLEYYSVDQKKWGQTHILASYVIFSCLQQADPSFFKFEFSQRDGKEYFTVGIDFDKIWTVGKDAIGKLIKHLQIYKSIGDGENGIKFFTQYAEVNDEIARLRKIVLEHKKPRRIELQHGVKLEADDNVTLVTFPENHKGVIESHIFHHQGEVEDVLEEFLGRHQYFRQ